MALAFAHVPNDHRPWLWVQDKTAIRLSGRPYRPGLPRSLRHRLIHVAADKAQDALFALEEGLRCRDLAFVIGEIAGNPAALDFTASRRLSLVSTKHGVPLWLVRLAARHDLARHGCVGMSPLRLVRRRNGIPRRQVIRAGRPICFARTPFNPVNGCLVMTDSTKTCASSRRIMAVWFPALPIDRWCLNNRRLEKGPPDDEPFVLAGETAHGPRITAVSRPARQAGARVGVLLADARAVAPGLIVYPADPAGDRALLETLALWAQQWGPWSALDAPDGLIIDVTGVPHLFGGETAMMADAGKRFAARGLSVRLGIAPTAGAAWAIAHHGADHGTLPPDADPLVALAGLPVAALRLDQTVVLLLERLGLKRIGDLAQVGRAALARRFRDRRSPVANPLIRLDQMAGRVPEPILPVLGVPVPMVQRRLMEPIRHRTLLDRVVDDLATALARLLEAGRAGRTPDRTGPVESRWRCAGAPDRAGCGHARSCAYRAAVCGSAG